eukprot:scaffold18473_cov64-Cyclotella_meneghiniana.AAC.2
MVAILSLLTTAPSMLEYNPLYWNIKSLLTGDKATCDEYILNGFVTMFIVIENRGLSQWQMQVPTR